MRSLRSALGSHSVAVGFVILTLGTATALAAANQNHEDTAKTAAKAEATAEQAKRLAEQNRRLVIALHNERADRLTTACKESNLAAKRATVAEYQRISSLLERIVPPPRTPAVQAAINLTIAADVQAVRQANPYRDCSARALGIKPLPASVLHPASSPPTTTAGSRSPPKGSQAGRTTTTQPRPPPQLGTTKPGRRRRPPHP